MFKVSLSDISAILNITLSSLESNVIEGITTDSRAVTVNNLFVPLSGEYFNGHNFINKAFENKASYCLCNESEFINNLDLHKFKEKLIIVNDTKEAYFSLMSYWRDQFKNVKCIGVGGSVGKTTTKEFIRRICEEDGLTVYTRENLNTPLGMCIAVNELQDNTKYLVCEMGTDMFGEITEEARIVKPDIGVCLSVTATHAQLLGGKIENVAEAESELVKNFQDKGIILLNKDDHYVYNMKDIIKSGKIITFGKSESDILLQTYKISKEGMIIDLNIMKEVSIPTFGEGNAYNAMAAITIAKELNIDEVQIRSGLKKYIPIKGRLNFFSISNNITVQDDSYNANPQSMKQSIDVFNTLAQNNKRIYVLGDMRELGEHAEESHKYLMDLIKSARPDILIYVGDFGNFIKEELNTYIKEIYILKNIDTSDAHKIVNDDEVKQAYNFVMSKMTPDSWVLFKASLGTGLWKVVEKVRQSII